MKNIFYIGCSHSAGNYGTDGKSVPLLLSERVKEKVLIYDFSEYCNSVYNQLFQIDQLKSQSPDFFIIQWTTPARLTFIEDRDKMYRLYRMSDTKKITDNYYVLDAKHNSPDYIKIKSGNGINLHVNASALKNMPSKNPRTQAYATLLTESLGVCGFHEHLYLHALKRYAQHMLNELNIPFIMYEHTNTNDLDYKILDFSVEKDIKKYKRFIVDKGNHFGIEGNLHVVENYLMPLLKEKLNV